MVVSVLGRAVGVPHLSSGECRASRDPPLRPGQAALQQREPLAASLKRRRLIPLDLGQALDLLPLCFNLVNHGRDDFRHGKLYCAVRLFGVLQFSFSSPDGHGQRTTPL